MSEDQEFYQAADAVSADYCPACEPAPGIAIRVDKDGKCLRCGKLLVDVNDPETDIIGVKKSTDAPKPCHVCNSTDKHEEWCSVPDAPKPPPPYIMLTIDLCAVCDEPVAKLIPIKPYGKPVRYVCESCYALFEGQKPTQVEAWIETVRLYAQNADFWSGRYEFLRRLNPRQFEALWKRNLEGENFDEMVDERIATGMVPDNPPDDAPRPMRSPEEVRAELENVKDHWNNCIYFAMSTAKWEHWSDALKWVLREEG